MNERINVRLLLLDASNRILLMKIDDAWLFEPNSLLQASPRWITIGGGMDPGETIEQTAVREGWEETGITNIAIGPAVYYHEEIGMLRGEQGIYKETFVVAHAPSCETDFANWTEQEKAVVKELRWWTLEELQATAEVIWPKWLASRLPDIVAGRYPETIEVIAP